MQDNGRILLIDVSDRKSWLTMQDLVWKSYFVQDIVFAGCTHIVCWLCNQRWLIVLGRNSMSNSLKFFRHILIGGNADAFWYHREKYLHGGICKGIHRLFCAKIQTRWCASIPMTAVIKEKPYFPHGLNGILISSSAVIGGGGHNLSTSNNRLNSDSGTSKIRGAADRRSLRDWCRRKDYRRS